MPYDLTISRWAELSETKKPLHEQDWESIVQDSNNLRIEDKYLEVFDDGTNQWVPLFWLDADLSRGFIRASGFLESPLHCDLGFGIAEKLQAFIVGDEDEVYYIPGHGEVDYRRVTISINDVIMYYQNGTNDYSAIIKGIIAAQNKKVKLYKVWSASKKPWWKFW